MTESVGTPQLIIYANNKTQYLQLSERLIWTFGRGNNNTVKLDDPCSSRRHAQLEVVEGQFYYFVDLGSSNGSLVNDRLIFEPELLKNGDRISIGNTNMIFEHNLDTITRKKFAQPTPQIAMLHNCALQAEFWQEILYSQGVEFLSETSDAEFTNYIDFHGASNTLPKILIMDVRAYQGNPYYFCRWCRRKYPQVLIFLTDSLRYEVSGFESQVAIKNGAMGLFSAIDRNDLHLNIDTIITQVNTVLKAVNNQPISNSDLFSILRLLSNRPVQNASMTLIDSASNIEKL